MTLFLCCFVEFALRHSAGLCGQFSIKKREEGQGFEHFKEIERKTHGQNYEPTPLVCRCTCFLNVSNNVTSFTACDKATSQVTLVPQNGLLLNGLVLSDMA